MSEPPSNGRSEGRGGAAEALLVGQRVIAALAGWKIAALIAAGLICLLLFVGLFLVAASGGASGTQVACSIGAGAGKEIPAEYVPWLERASARFHLGQRGFAIVAAIHKIESDFGRSTLPGVKSGTNSAGAAGPGQFLAGTWAAYGQDADGDGRRDIYGVPDSVFATANYLHASGAPGDWRGAIFSYNHADWYVNEVLAQAERYQGDVTCRLVGTPAAGVELGQINWNDTSGPWGGSKKFADLARQIAQRDGCSVISAKRTTQNTASGGVSDHWIGARHSFAYDFDACDLQFPGGQADQSANDIAAAFDLPAHTGVVNAYRGRYRIQLLWQTYTGGDHYNHVHIGIRNLCCPGG